MGGLGGFNIKPKESLYYKVLDLPNKPVGYLSPGSIQVNRQAGKPAAIALSVIARTTIFPTITENPVQLTFVMSKC
jgi:hypothetical protein